MARWIPTPGQIAAYTGRSGSSHRNMLVVAEAVGGRFVVEAIGRKGVVVRLTVKRESLVQPQPDLFEFPKPEEGIYLGGSETLPPGAMTTGPEQVTYLLSAKPIPGESIEELKRMLLAIPKNKRKEIVALGIKLAKLKQERKELLKKRDELLTEQGTTVESE